MDPPVSPRPAPRPDPSPPPLSPPTQEDIGGHFTVGRRGTHCYPFALAVSDCASRWAFNAEAAEAILGRIRSQHMPRLRLSRSQLSLSKGQPSQPSQPSMSQLVRATSALNSETQSCLQVHPFNSCHTTAKNYHPIVQNEGSRKLSSTWSGRRGPE